MDQWGVGSGLERTPSVRHEGHEDARGCSRHRSDRTQVPTETPPHPKSKRDTGPASATRAEQPSGIISQTAGRFPHPRRPHRRCTGMRISQDLDNFGQTVNERKKQRYPPSPAPDRNKTPLIPRTSRMDYEKIIFNPRSEERQKTRQFQSSTPSGSEHP